jgi:hypothetical protein
MTTEQAIEQARRFARAHGYDVARYDATAVKKGQEWLVDFRSRESRPRPGDFFSVSFNEQAPSAMRLVPGK